MPVLPSFFLKRLYVKGSLVNTPEGCAFSLRNGLGAGSLTQFYGLVVDGQSYPAEAFSVLLPNGEIRPGNEVSPEAPLALASDVTYIIRLNAVRLARGQHALKLRILTRELGALDIAISDAVGEKPAAGPGAAAKPAAAASVDPPPVARPLRIAIIGAGSAVFARQLMADVLTAPGLDSGAFVLVDIDARRLDLAHRIGERMAAASGRRWRIEATAHRQKALAGCDYVINTIEVAGLRNVRHDYDIPMKYGIDQCIGDTIGPGGIFKMLRTGPAWLQILGDIERLCPRAVVMNYTNPLSALTLLALRATRLNVIGLCHSVQDTSQRLASYLDVPFAELRWRCAGINHLAWFTELTRGGEDMYPRLAERARDPEVYEADPIRFEVMRHFGAFVTESSGHLSEYVPYFRKRPELIAKYARAGYRGESGFYANNWPDWRQGGDDSIRDIIEGRSTLVMQRSDEYASAIIEGIELARPQVIHGNVANLGLIDNLPSSGCVEVPVLVDATGMHPVRFGPLPPQMAALDMAHMPVHELMVAAVLDRDARAARRALLLDPLSAAVCSPEEIGSLFDEMWQAERQDLAWFEK
ncbi:MAG: alpha-galactosidase [Spirochaetia bacterium]|jgi:alpha-galactosidase